MNKRIKRFFKSNLTIFCNLKKDKTIILSLIFTIVSTIFIAISPKLLGDVTTGIFNGIITKISNDGNIDLYKISKILIILLILYIISTIFNFIGIFLIKKTNNNIKGLIIKIEILLVMFKINSFMTFFVIFNYLIFKLIRKLLNEKYQKYYKDSQQYLTIMNNKTEEIINGHNTIKGFNAEEKMIKNFEIDNNAFLKLNWKCRFISNVLLSLMNLANNIGYIFIIILGGYLCIKGEITIGNILSFIIYNWYFIININIVIKEQEKLN